MTILTTGEMANFKFISNQTNSAEVYINYLSYGGFLVINFYENSKAIDGYVIDENGDYVAAWGSFGPEFIRYNIFWRNNTILALAQNGDKITTVSKAIPRLRNLDYNNDYDNIIIESTIPSIRDIVDPTIEKLSIKYNIPIKLSSSNISIFQVNDGNGPDILRQTFPGNSKFCRIDEDGQMIHVEIFNSTFSLPNATYYVKIEGNFVANPTNDEPLVGINKKYWFFSTSPFRAGKPSESVNGIVRLDTAASQIFREANETDKMEYFDKIFQEFSKKIPIDSERFSTKYISQQDPNSPDKELLSFTIIKADNITTQKSSEEIFEILKTLVANKEYNEFVWNKYTATIEDITINRKYFIILSLIF
jgi:hypothetical protein